MFKYIYQLNHKYISKYTDKNEPLYDEKELGYFSSRKKVDAIIEKYKPLEGFKEHSIDCFVIKKQKLECINGAIPFKFFELYHSYIDKDGFEDYDYFGIYPTKELAMRKIEKLKKQKSIYRKFPDGFDIAQEIIDSDNIIWNEGFSPWNEE